MGIELRGKNGAIDLSLKMIKGDDGGYYIPSLDSEGNLTWAPSETEMPAVEGANIKGPKGDTGTSGVWVGDTEPTGDYNVWIDPTGSETAGLVTQAELATKQDKLTAGDNITIDNNNVISTNGLVTQAELANKQDKLTPGDNITIENNVISASAPPTATTSTLGLVKPDGTSITIADGTISSTQPTKTSELTNDSGFITNEYHDATKQDKLTAGTNITIDSNNVISATGGGGSGGANADEATIITNAEGKLETAIGGKWVDGLIDGPVIVNISTQNADVSSILTYDIMQELISKGDRLRASLSSGFGKEKGCLVDIDTSVADTYKLTCKYTIVGNIKIVYTGIGTKDNWKCSRGFEGGSADFSSTENYFYSLIDGKVPSPISSADFLPIGRDFKVEDNKLSLRYLKRTSKGGYYLTSNNNGSDVRNVGNHSFVFGDGNIYASGEFSGAIGSNSSNKGYSAYTIGNQVYGETNNYVFITGMICMGTNHFQFISGNFSNWYDKNRAEGAQVFGKGCISSSDWSMTAGKYNANDTNKEYAHVVGNGTSNSSRSNAYTLDWQGNGTFAGTVSSSTGADYAEYFEWKDGNPNNEDRVGYIVTLDGDKIVKANSGDDILGICSGTAMVLGDSAEWNWSKRYLTDDFGRIIYENRMEHHEAIYNLDGELIKEAWDEEVYAPKQNPDYDTTKTYTKRADRPEWQIVGMMGKLYVRDDGSCVVNGYADVVNGIATKATGKTNMRVMERINDSIVRVLLK